ncbi:MAG: ABC transporter ATP-binding protein [Lachnospiraceae bacterium]|nr:ABC transporter ATP-binding protein [Lachnospiraceae bacterium]
MAKTDKFTAKRIFSYLKKYMWMVVLSLILSLVYVFGTLYVPILIGRAVDGIVGPGDVNLDLIFDIGLRFVIVVAISALSQWVMGILNNKITFHVTKDIREDAFNKIHELPFSYLDAHSHGDLVSRVIADVDTFADGLLMGFTQLFTGVATILGTLFFMFKTNVIISLVVVLLTPLSLLVARFIARSTHKMFLLQSETRGEQTGLINEIIGNEKTVKALSMEENAIERFEEINDRLGACSLKAVFYSSLVNPSTRFINSMVYAGVGISGAMIAISGGISIGMLTTFLSYANQYTKPFNEISGVITELQNAFVCAKRCFELIDSQSQTPDPTDAVPLKEVEGNVSVCDISFSYSPDKPLIEHYSLEAKKGQRIAIVGPTGCGKTTFINLLMRFYDVNSGKILVDDVDTKTVTREDLRSNYGMVLQDTWLRSGTIKENIAFGKPGATDEEIINAAKEAHAHSFIKRLPKGYDTYIGEDGGSLSQGQKQLLCIARVMLSLPPMLILDEATSSIDTRTEIRIQKAFARMMEGRTSFVVAHRLSTIKEADIIIVMKDGHIIEQGRHDELLAKGGFYAKMYNS